MKTSRGVVISTASAYENIIRLSPGGRRGKYVDAVRAPGDEDDIALI